MNKEQVKKSIQLFCELYDLDVNKIMLAGYGNGVMRNLSFRTQEIELYTDQATLKRLAKIDSLKRREAYGDKSKWCLYSVYFNNVTIEAYSAEMQTDIIDEIPCLVVQRDELLKKDTRENYWTI